MVNQDNTVEKASRGYIKDFYKAKRLLTNIDKTAQGLLPDFDRDEALRMIRKDYAVQTAITKLVDKTIENGYDFSAEDNKSNLDSFNETRRKIRLDREMVSWLYQLYGYQNCFIEIVNDGNNKIKELHTLETTQTEPVLTANGEIKGYVQTIPYDNTEPIFWNPDEVTHIKLNMLTTGAWSDLEIQSIWTSVLIKQYIMQYFGWKYGTNQLRPLYNIKEASDDDVKDFLSYWKGVQKDISKPLIFDGKVEKIMMAECTEEQPLLSVLQMMDENIYSVLGVPPIASNETGQSNRSSADQQIKMMAVRIKYVQRMIKEALENDLFPKMNFNKIKINWKPVIKSDISTVMETAERMKNIGIKIELIEKFLIDEGFYDEKEIFDKELEQQKKEMMPGMGQKSEDMYPSRTRKPEGESNKQIGTGEESTTRKDQLVSKGESKFNDYPYVI